MERVLRVHVEAEGAAVDLRGSEADEVEEARLDPGGRGVVQCVQGGVRLGQGAPETKAPFACCFCRRHAVSLRVTMARWPGPFHEEKAGPLPASTSSSVSTAPPVCAPASSAVFATPSSTDGSVRAPACLRRARWPRISVLLVEPSSRRTCTSPPKAGSPAGAAPEPSSRRPV